MNDKKLIPLDEHNEVAARWAVPTKNIPNGIACPKCGKEMMDTDRSFRTASIPPKFTCHCPACLHRDWRNC